jgi:hypothetical protein
MAKQSCVAGGLGRFRGMVGGMQLLPKQHTLSPNVRHSERSSIM